MKTTGLADHVTLRSAQGAVSLFFMQQVVTYPGAAPLPGSIQSARPSGPPASMKAFPHEPYLYHGVSAHDSRGYMAASLAYPQSHYIHSTVFITSTSPFAWT